eukprot:scaffold252327_cov15-Tisochrysis_lutea.AAC.1
MPRILNNVVIITIKIGDGLLLLLLIAQWRWAVHVHPAYGPLDALAPPACPAFLTHQPAYQVAH